jgi:hypothetical protein
MLFVLRTALVDGALRENALEMEAMVRKEVAPKDDVEAARGASLGRNAVEETHTVATELLAPEMRACMLAAWTRKFPPRTVTLHPPEEGRFTGTAEETTS